MIFTSRIFLCITGGALLFHQPRLNSLQAQTPPTSQQQLLEEVKSLRKELFEHLHERQTEKVQALEKELDQFHREYVRIETTLEAREREMTEWTNELQTSELSPRTVHRPSRRNGTPMPKACGSFEPSAKVQPRGRPSLLSASAMRETGCGVSVRP